MLNFENFGLTLTARDHDSEVSYFREGLKHCIFCVDGILYILYGPALNHDKDWFLEK